MFRRVALFDPEGLFGAIDCKVRTALMIAKESVIIRYYQY